MFSAIRDNPVRAAAVGHNIHAYKLTSFIIAAAYAGFAGGLLGVLYGALYSLLQLEDVALLSGSILLFALLSLAMWFTRNLHRPQSA